MPYFRQLCSKSQSKSLQIQFRPVVLCYVDVLTDPLFFRSFDWLIHALLFIFSLLKRTLVYFPPLFSHWDRTGVPKVLWAVYFSQKKFHLVQNDPEGAPANIRLPANVKLVSGPSDSLDYEDVLNEVRHIAFRWQSLTLFYFSKVFCHFHVLFLFKRTKSQYFWSQKYHALFICFIVRILYFFRESKVKKSFFNKKCF